MSERERQIPYDITAMWNLKYDTNEPMKQKHNHRHTEQTSGCQRGGIMREGWYGGLGLADVSFHI